MIAERTNTVTVLLVDDEPDLLLLLRTMLGLDNRIQVTGEAADGAEALRLAHELDPNVVVLDQRIPVMNGLEVAERMLADNPERKVILFTAYLDTHTQEAARDLGIQSVLSKDDIGILGQEILRLAG